MKTSLIFTLIFFTSGWSKSSAQNIDKNELCKLVVYEKLLNDTSVVSAAEFESTKINTQKTPLKNVFLSDNEITKLVEGITEFENFKEVILLSSKNKKIENKMEFENCYLHKDTMQIENPKTKVKSTKVFQVNYLSSNSIIKVKFYEKWTFDALNLKMNKEILAYSMVLCKFMNGTKWVDELLFTVVSNKNAFDYLISNEYLK